MCEPKIWWCTMATPGSSKLLTTCDGGSSSAPHSKRSGSMPTLTAGESLRSWITLVVVVTVVDEYPALSTCTTGAATAVVVLVLDVPTSFALRYRPTSLHAMKHTTATAATDGQTRHPRPNAPSGAAPRAPPALQSSPPSSGLQPPPPSSVALAAPSSSGSAASPSFASSSSLPDWLGRHAKLVEEECEGVPSRCVLSCGR